MLYFDALTSASAFSNACIARSSNPKILLKLFRVILLGLLVRLLPNWRGSCWVPVAMIVGIMVDRCFRLFPKLFSL